MLKEKYAGKLEKEISGPEYEIISKIMKALVNRKITVPGSFIGYTQSSQNTLKLLSLHCWLSPEPGLLFSLCLSVRLSDRPSL